jgi:hypothetical protein
VNSDLGINKANPASHSIGTRQKGKFHCQETGKMEQVQEGN